MMQMSRNLVAGRCYQEEQLLVVCVMSDIVADKHNELFLNGANELIPIRKVVDLLTHSAGFAGKPKLFFFLSTDTSNSDILLVSFKIIANFYYIHYEVLGNI
jgi:hypothetical protein